MMTTLQVEESQRETFSSPAKVVKESSVEEVGVEIFRWKGQRKMSNDFSFAVTNTMTQSIFRELRFVWLILLGPSPPLSSQSGKPSRNLKQKSWRNAECSMIHSRLLSLYLWLMLS